MIVLESYSPGYCESCEHYRHVRIPIAGSETNVAYLCIQCIESRGIAILQEYIERFGIKTEAI